MVTQRLTLVSDDTFVSYDTAVSDDTFKSGKKWRSLPTEYGHGILIPHPPRDPGPRDEL